MKKIYFWVCIFILIFTVIICFFSKNKLYTNIDLSNLTKNDIFVVGISCNNNIGAYDLNSKTYYFSKNTFNINKIKVISPYKVKYTIEKLSNEKYTIFIYSNKYYQEKTIKLLDNSIITMNDFKEISNYKKLDLAGNYSRDYTNIIFNIMDNKESQKSFISKARIKVRGAGSVVFPKKSFKIEFPSKQSFFNISDDDWVLDALYIDKSKIRNLFSYNLWNEINDNQLLNNDLNGQFVEIFINNEYYGLYVLKDKVGKEITDINDNGLLIKSVEHLTKQDIYSLLSDYNIKKDNIFLNYEIKNYSANAYNTFVNKLKNYYKQEENYESINDTFDLHNYINYKIFVCLIGGTDNITKNQYLSMKDEYSKIQITPWDLDLTWGLSWNDFDEENLHSTFSIESSSDIEWIEDNIAKNMDEKTLSLLRDRYWELRKNVITMNNINNYLDSYKDLLVNSGAAERDSNRWYKYDVEFEIEQIREWTNKRIEFLDEYFKY